MLQLLADLYSFKTGGHSRTIENWKPPFDSSPELVLTVSQLIREYIRQTLSAAGARTGDYFHGLLDFRSEHPVDVFTLNYDRLVESMAARFNIRFTTGFGEAWDPSLFEHKDLDLRLYKLHGSVDWYRLAARNVIYRGSPEHPAFPGETAQDVLLYPARGKAAHADPFATLTSLFNRALSDADFCIAIGHSFRDQHIRRAVLDRMATNRSLQLLIVNPTAHDVMALQPEEPDEPAFAQFADRVSGLWMEARYALENRAIAQRLVEIRNADSYLTNVVQYRTSRQFDQAASNLFGTMEYCRTRDLPYKPSSFLKQPVGAEFQKAIVTYVANQAGGLKISNQPFEQWEATQVVPRLAQLATMWAFAAALAPDETSGLESELSEVFRQLVSRMVFMGHGEYRLWVGGIFLADQEITVRRWQILEALSKELKTRSPHAALAVADGAARERYKALSTGAEALAYYYKEVAQYPVRRGQIRGEEFFALDTGGWQTVIAHASSWFLDSKMPEAWLPPPPFKGPLRDIDSV